MKKLIVSTALVVGIITFMVGWRDGYLPDKDAYVENTFEMAEEQSQTPEPTFDDLLDAICWVESGCNANTLGDSGRAVGAYQITKAYVDDVNRILGEDRYKYADRWDAVKSREMVRRYTGFYYGHYLINTGRFKTSGTATPANFEVMARIHNAGPDGWRDDPQWFVWNRGYTLNEAIDKIVNAKEFWYKVETRIERRIR
jgi:hypothetical protein